MSDVEPFTGEDFGLLSGFVVDAWQAGVDRDWTVPAGTLEWSCLETADHTIDCVFSYALFLASRRQDAYPSVGELHALPGSGPRDMVDGIRAVTTILWAVITTADPAERAILLRWPQPETGVPNDFAARGAMSWSSTATTFAPGSAFPSPPRSTSAAGCSPTPSAGPARPRWPRATTAGPTSWSDLVVPDRADGFRVDAVGGQ